MIQDNKNKFYKQILKITGLMAILWIFNITIIHQIIYYLHKREYFHILNNWLDQSTNQTLSRYIDIADQHFLILIFSIFFYFLLFKAFKRLFLIIQRNSDVLIKNGKTTWYEFLIVGFIYSIITIIFFYPIIRILTTSIIGPPEDNIQGMWNIWLGYEMFADKSFIPASTNSLFYPEGVSLLYHDISFLNYSLSLLLKPLDNIIFTYNILVIYTFPLAGLGMYMLTKYLINNRCAAIIGGFIFAFSPYHFAHALHHINLASIQFIPFFVLFFIKAVKKPSKLNTTLASIFFFLNTITHWNYFIFCCFFVLFVYIYLAIRRRKIIILDLIFKSAVVVGLTIIILSPWIYQMAMFSYSNPDINTNINEFDWHVTDLVGLITPHYHHLLGSSSLVESVNNNLTGNPWEKISYLGIVCIFLIIVFFKKIIKKSALYFIGLITFLLLAGGTIIHAYGIEAMMVLPNSVIQYIPLISGARIPARYIIFIYLFLAIIISIIIKHIIDNTKSKKASILIISIISFLLFIDYYSPVKDYTTPSLPECYEEIKNEGNYGILNLPRDSYYSTRYMLHQTFHEKPIANGYILRRSKNNLIDNLITADLDKQKQQLVDNNISHVIIHKKLKPKTEKINIDEYKNNYNQICENEDNLVLKIKDD